jgi:hypothetical protein
MPGLVLAFLFLALGLACIDDYGATWDERETYLTSRKVAGGAAESGEASEGWHVLPGYFFVFDLARGLFSRLLVERMELLDWIECQHLFHLLLASLSVFLLYQAAFLLSERVRPALWIALALALFPKFVGHAQSNPKDLPALSAFVLVLYAMARLHVRKSWGNALLSGAALGFAFSVRELTVALPVVFGIWFWWVEGRRVLAHWRKGLVVALVAALVFLACWPWLWPDPLGRLSGAVRHFGTLVFDRKVLYLGEIHRTVSLPWHYTLVSLLIATPTVFLAAAALSALTPDPEQRPAFQRIRRLACLWIVALFALDAAATTHYDGFRHLLVVLPGLCMLIGLGLENLAHLSARWLGTEPVKESRAACELRRTRRGGVAAPPSIPPPIRVGAAPCHDASCGLSARGGFSHGLSSRAPRSPSPRASCLPRCSSARAGARRRSTGRSKAAIARARRVSPGRRRTIQARSGARPRRSSPARRPGDSRTWERPTRRARAARRAALRPRSRRSTPGTAASSTAPRWAG